MVQPSGVRALPRFHLRPRTAGILRYHPCNVDLDAHQDVCLPPLFRAEHGLRRLLPVMWRDTEGARTSDGIPPRLISGCLLPLRYEASATPWETRKIHVLAVWRDLLLDLRTEDCHDSMVVPYH